MANYFDPELQYEAMKDVVQQTIKDQFPFEGKRQELRLVKSWVEDKPNRHSKRATKEARINEHHNSSPVLGHLKLIDKDTGKVIDEVKRMRLARVPVPTPMTGGYLINGSEFQISNQERLKPGVYTRRTGAGHLEAQANLAKGMNFALGLNPERRRLTARFGTTNIGLYELMRILGASEDEIKNRLGSDLYDANVVSPKKVGAAAQRLHGVLFMRRGRNQAAPDEMDAKRDLREYFQETEIDRDTTKETLGKGFSRVTSDLIMTSAEKLLKVQRGEEEPDNRNAPMFKRFYGPEDQLEAKLQHRNTQLPISFRVRGRIDNKKDIRSIVNNRTFDDPVTKFFTEGSLSNATEQNNPLSILGEANKTTVLGEGGIPSDRGVPEDARSLEPSSLHFHDPVQTPESSRVGITLHVGIDTEREDKTIKTKVREINTNRNRALSPEQAFRSTIAFPDQYDGHKPKSRMVKAIKEGKIAEYPSSKVDFIYDRPQGAFAISANMVPFLDSTQPTRALTASKQMEQAVSLIDREEPLVQTSNGKGGTFDEEIGRDFSTSAPVSGTVSKIEDDQITIRDKAGKNHKVELWHEYPLNQKTFLTEKPKVEKGDKVSKGDLLADSNYTKDGKLALGINLRTAYAPYYGLTFEDAVAISESAANKLTSEHLYQQELPLDENTSLSLNKFRAHSPGAINATQAAKLDNKGIIKKGETIEKGDVMVAMLREESVTPEDTLLSRLVKSRARPWKDRAMRWDHDHPGIVTDVVDLGDKVKVMVKTEEPAREGDKLVGRHGNKGIITRVVPDTEMLKDANGDVIDLVMDPHTVPSRINIGQNLENAIGKLAKKQGKPFIVNNFSDMNNATELQDMLKSEGMRDKETIFDPISGKNIPNVQVGQHYTNKLKHQIEHKFGVRNVEGYDTNLQPKGGKHGAQSLDRLTMYAMLAHDARSNLREMQSDTKAQKNDELWLRVQSGMPLPVPKETFSYQKFKGLVKGMGIDIKEDGQQLSLLPLTDKEVELMSSGALPEPTKAISRNTMTPELGGLFDPQLVGGLRGDKWSHIDLAEQIPNPSMEKGILSLTGLKKTEFDSIISGKSAIDENGNVVPSDTWS